MLKLNPGAARLMNEVARSDQERPIVDELVSWENIDIDNEIHKSAS